MERENWREFRWFEKAKLKRTTWKKKQCYIEFKFINRLNQIFTAFLPLCRFNFIRRFMFNHLYSICIASNSSPQIYRNGKYGAAVLTVERFSFNTLLQCTSSWLEWHNARIHIIQTIAYTAYVVKCYEYTSRYTYCHRIGCDCAVVPLTRKSYTRCMCVFVSNNY